MSDQRKRVLDNRYELEEVLGQGGMAKVFRGHDRILGRTVALKVLAPQFAGDEQFVTRFRREAQAAAALNHPNIVGVFDTGDQGDVHYIVMEYVQGRTLRDAIRSDGALLPERATEIADSVAKALASAHEAGLVHRDVKPGNIMLTSDGEVKVMDFGIARTSTGDTLTQTAAILGTASYLSPEQAQGAAVDARSDIYSLGCVLYEMLTGQPPFTGDSPVSIAYKHVKEDPSPPSRLNPDVPASLDAVVMKCLAKNPENRYRDAEELRQDLQRVMQGMPTLATPVLAAGATEVIPRSPDATAVMTEVPPEEEPGRRRRPWLTALVVILVLALVGLAAFFLVQQLLPQETTVSVPNVVGQTEEEATARLQSLGLEVTVEDEANDTVPQGEVFEQDPQAGADVEEGSEVTIVVSKGAPKVEVPSLMGLTLDEARDVLDEAGLTLGTVTREPSDQEEGTVVLQEPGAGARVDADTSVDVTVSSGPELVTVPDVICEPIDVAESIITGAGLQFQVAGSRPDETCPAGTVASQNPGANESVVSGSIVRVRESLGPPEEPSPSPTVTPSP